jgi:hypothetical protein
VRQCPHPAIPVIHDACLRASATTNVSSRCPNCWHVLLVPEDLAVARVVNRVTHGDHDVPEDKVRARFVRLWGYLRDAIEVIDEARV